jgi:hypothetical protein
LNSVFFFFFFFWRPKTAKYHKGCFKCATCTTRVTLTTYKSKGGEIYCVKCVPKEAHTSVADSVVMETARKGESLKKEVNIQKSNVITGERGSQTADSMASSEAKKASELNRAATAVKSNVITGERGTQTADSMATTEAKKASELNRAATAVKSNVITGERGTQTADDSAAQQRHQGAEGGLVHQSAKVQRHHGREPFARPRLDRARLPVQGAARCIHARVGQRHHWRRQHFLGAARVSVGELKGALVCSKTH